LLIARIRAALPKARIILMSMNPVWKGYEAGRPRLAAYYAQYGAIARQQGVDFLDNYPDWLDLLNNHPETFQSMVADGVHPSVEAHRAVTVRNIASLLTNRPCAAARNRDGNVH
jgi:lysophospholipase L1-like esterase